MDMTKDFGRRGLGKLYGRNLDGASEHVNVDV